MENNTEKLNANNGFSVDQGTIDEHDALGNSRAFQSNIIVSSKTDKYASHYSMNHKYTGRALIFNHEHFKVGGLKSRAGTENDCKNINKCLKGLGFDVTVCQDLDYTDLQKTVQEFANADYTDYDCFIMVILSHGESGILYSRNAPYKPELLWSPFSSSNCRTLAGKPKLFFIQACQGDKLDGGITLSSTTETDGNPSASYRMPEQADFLIAYSTIPGYYSWRNTTRGSWFMQALCQELENNAYNYDLLTLLTFVNQRVAIDYESNTPDIPHMHKQKQIPCITTMLTRLFKFKIKA